MIDIHTIIDVIPTISITVGVIYYIMVLRNQEKARSTQLATHVSNKLQDIERSKIGIELLEMKWNDFEEFYNKYDSTINIDNYAKRTLIFGIYNEFGVLLKKNLIDIKTVYDLMGVQRPMLMWNKFEPIINEQRKSYNDPDYYHWFEYLIQELKKERVRRGHKENIIDADKYTTS
jgi:hypothetical protein